MTTQTATCPHCQGKHIGIPDRLTFDHTETCPLARAANITERADYWNVGVNPSSTYLREPTPDELTLCCAMGDPQAWRVLVTIGEGGLRRTCITRAHVGRSALFPDHAAAGLATPTPKASTPHSQS